MSWLLHAYLLYISCVHAWFESVSCVWCVWCVWVGASKQTERIHPVRLLCLLRTEWRYFISVYRSRSCKWVRVYQPLQTNVRPEKQLMAKTMKSFCITCNAFITNLNEPFSYELFQFREIMLVWHRPPTLYSIWICIRGIVRRKSSGIEDVEALCCPYDFVCNCGDCRNVCKAKWAGSACWVRLTA